MNGSYGSTTSLFEYKSNFLFSLFRHGYDPNTYGAYSVTFAGWEDHMHEVLRQPLKICGKTRVRFAGEAMCDDLNGYTHGAGQSGKETAARLLYESGLGPDPRQDDSLQLCDW